MEEEYLTGWDGVKRFTGGGMDDGAGALPGFAPMSEVG